MIRARRLAALAFALPGLLASAELPIAMPDRLGTFERVDSAAPVTATYVEPGNPPGGALVSVYVRSLGRSATEDLAANEAPLREVAGVREPGTLLADVHCPGVVARIDRGWTGTATLTASVYAVRANQNVKMRATAAATRGEPFMLELVRLYRDQVLGCGLDS